MAKTDFNSSRSIPAYYRGSRLVEVTPGRPGPNGTWIDPVMRREIVNSTSSPYTVLREQRIGSSTPGFGSPKRTGPLRPLAFAYQVEKYSPQTRTYTENRPSRNGDNPIDTTDLYVNWSFIDFNAVSPIAQSTIDAAIRRLTTSVRNELKNQSINVAQAIAERKQTASTVTNAATRIAKAITAVGRRDMRAAADALGVKVSKRAIRRNSRIKDQSQAVANGWLELNYGWQPLLNDVYGAAEALAKSQNNVLIGRVRKRMTLTGTGTKVTRDVPPSGWSGYGSSQVTVTVTRNTQISVRYSRSSSQPATLKELGITNPALLAWELLPYSFVFDWFLPVGNWLSSLDATIGLNFLDGYRTDFIRTNSFGTNYKFFTNRSYIGWNQNDITAGTYEKIVCVRSVLSDFPAAMTPRFKNPVSASHMASAMALLRQSFKR